MNINEQIKVRVSLNTFLSIYDNQRLGEGERQPARIRLYQQIRNNGSLTWDCPITGAHMDGIVIEEQVLLTGRADRNGNPLPEWIAFTQTIEGEGQ